MRTKNLPVMPSASGEAASQTAVSAPFSGDLEKQLLRLRSERAEARIAVHDDIRTYYAGVNGVYRNARALNFSARAYVNISPASLLCE